MRTRARSTSKLCLRCDWEGEASDRTCPRCDAPLWTPRTAPVPKPPSRLAKARLRIAARAERRAQIVSGVTAAEASPTRREDVVLQPGSRSRKGWVPTVAILTLAVVAIAVVRAGTPAKPVFASTAFIGGSVLYVAPDPEASVTRLWVWNLESGTVTAGPRVQDPVRLTDASDTGAGHVAVISETGGVQSAGLLRFLASTDVAVPFLQGRSVSWSPGGRAATAVTTEARASGCDLVVVRELIETTSRVEDVWRGPVCGTVTGVQRTPTSTFLSLDDVVLDGSPPQPVTYFISGGGLSRPLAGLRLLGVTRSNDLFLEGSDGVLWGANFPRSRNRVPYGDGHDRLSVEQMLGLTWDGDDAYVLGAMGGVRGIYRAPGFGQFGTKVPELVMRTDATDVSVTESDRDVPIVLAGGRFLIQGDEGTSSLSLPDGAPAPTGPILWLEHGDTG